MNLLSNLKVRLKDNSMPNNNTSKILNLEKQIKPKLFDTDMGLVREYLTLLKEDRYNKFINATDEFTLSLLVGELKTYEKLLNIFTI